MAVVSFKNISARIIDLFFRRVMILFLVGGLLCSLLINQHTLKIKTLNYLLPLDADLLEFRDHPDQMDRDKLKDILIYYRSIYGFEKKDPEGPAPCGIAAYAFYYSGKKDTAIEYYNKAIRLNNRFFWFYYNLGVIYYNDEHYDKAIEYFAKALSIEPQDSMYFLVLTKTYKDFLKVFHLEIVNYGQSLSEGYEHARKFLVICKMFIDQPDIKAKIERKKIDLRLF